MTRKEELEKKIKELQAELEQVNKESELPVGLVFEVPLFVDVAMDVDVGYPTLVGPAPSAWLPYGASRMVGSVRVFLDDDGLTLHLDDDDVSSLSDVDDLPALERMLAAYRAAAPQVTITVRTSNLDDEVQRDRQRLAVLERLVAAVKEVK